MKVVYTGHMTGYHVIRKDGFRLVPGVNEVSPEHGKMLLDAGFVIPIEETHHREVQEILPIGNIEPADELNDERAQEGTS